MKILSCAVVAAMLFCVLSQIPVPTFNIVNYNSEIKLFSNGTDGDPCAVQVTEIIEYEFEQDLDDSTFHLERIIPKNLGSYGIQTLPRVTTLDVKSLDEAVEVVNFTAVPSEPLISFDFRADDPDLLDETITFQLTYTIHGILHIDPGRRLNILKWGQQIPKDATIAENRISIDLPKEWVFQNGEVIVNTVSGPIKLDSADKIVLESNDILDFDLQFPLRATQCSVSEARAMGLASPFHYYHPHSTWLIGGGVGFVLLLACIGSFCCLGYLLLNEDATKRGKQRRREKLEPLLAEEREAPSYVNINRDTYKQAPGAKFGQEEFVNEPMEPSGRDQVQLDIPQESQQPLLNFEPVQVQGKPEVEQEPIKSFEEVQLSPERASKKKKKGRDDNV